MRRRILSIGWIRWINRNIQHNRLLSSHWFEVSGKRLDVVSLASNYPNGI